MKPLAQALSAALQYAIVSRQVSEEGEFVGFLYHEPPAFEQDSGWRIFSGNEDDDYADNPDNFITAPLRNVLDTHPEIAALMSQTNGAWEWDNTQQHYIAVTDWQPQN